MHNYNFSLPVNAGKKGTTNGEGLTKLIFTGLAASGMVGIIIYGAWQVVTKTTFRLQKTISSPNKDSTILRNSTKNDKNFENLTKQSYEIQKLLKEQWK